MQIMEEKTGEAGPVDQEVEGSSEEGVTQSLDRDQYEAVPSQQHQYYLPIPHPQPQQQPGPMMPRSETQCQICGKFNHTAVQ